MAVLNTRLANYFNPASSRAMYFKKTTAFNQSLISGKAFLTVLLMSCLLLTVFNTKAQMRQIHLDVTNTNNGIKKLSFYSASEGYIACTESSFDWVGYTTDSGHTYIKRYITLANVNYNGFSVNLTFGFGISGVKAFNQNNILVYGDYGLVPAILSSTNGGVSYTLIYHSQFDPFALLTGIEDMAFPENNNIGYAIDGDRILKTTNQGLSWSPSRVDPNSLFNAIEAVDNNTVFVMSWDYTTNRLLKTINGGTNWTQVVLPTLPGGKLAYAHFLTASTGWLSMYDNNNNYYFYKTTTGGSSWTLQNNIEANPFAGTRIKFLDNNTGYAFWDQNTVYKTFDSGVTWEPLPRDNNFSYLGFSHEVLQVFSPTQLWAGGYRAFLELSTNGGGTPLPKSYFRADTVGYSNSGIVNLINHSRTGYTYKWFLNSGQISTNYNTSYTHNVNYTTDTVTLVVSNGTRTDTTIKYLYFNPPVVVSSFTPTSAGTGTVVTITGQNFSSATSVSFGGVPASGFTVISPTSINATVGAGASGTVRVITPLGQGTKGGFTYIPQPTISSFSPTSATAGTIVIITGTGLTGATAVSFGGVPASSYNVVSATTITATAPSGPSGNVSVTTPGGTATLPGYISLPTVTAFTPIQGTQGTILNITGTSFSGATGVTVGGVNAISFTVNSSTSIQAIVGSGATGGVTVTKPGGSSTLPGFTWFAPPVITSFSPASGPVGTTVTITGTGFHPTATNNTVYFGSLKATVTGGNSTSLTVTVPMGATFQPISVLSNNLIGYSAYPFLVTFTGGSITASTFATRTVIGVGSGNGPMNVSIGDVDGDGKNDLLVAQYATPATNNGIYIYRNTSSGATISFATPVILAPNDYQGCTVGDLDGDGKMDVAVMSNSTIRVYRSTSAAGTISFAPFINLTCGNAAKGITINDIDGDGKADIAIDHYPDAAVSLFRNISEPGNLAFVTRLNIAIPGGRNIVLADLDGDKKPDLIVPDAVNNSSAILKNNSTKGVFSFGNPLNLTGFTHSYMDYGDFDGDGKADIVSGDLNGSQIAVYRNTSSGGTISMAAAVTFPSATTPAGVAVSDLDGDGKPDIAVVLGNYNLAVFRNTSSTGNISFAPKENYIAGTYNGEHMLALGDINNDGRNDAVVISEVQKTISIHVNDISPVPFIQSFTPTAAATGTSVTISGSNFTGTTAVSFGGVPAASFVVNSPSSITAVVGTGANGSVSVTSPQGTGSLAGFIYLTPPIISSFNPTSGPAGTLVTITGSNFTGSTSVKFGGSAASSFTIVSPTTITATIGLGLTGNISITNPSGTGSLGTFTYVPGTAPVITSINPLSAPLGASVTITGNNFNTNPAGNFVFFGSIRATVTSATATSLTVTVPAGATYAPITVTNGHLTAISSKKFSTSFSGSEVFTPESFAAKLDSATGHTSGHSEVYFVDLNNDNKLDVLVTGANGFTVFRNTSTGNGELALAPRQNFFTNYFSKKAAYADIDGDGRQDVIIADWSTKAAVARNISTGSTIAFDTLVTMTTSDQPGSIAVADLDGDGKPDLAVSNYLRSNVSVFRNTTIGGAISFTPKTDYPVISGPYDVKLDDLDNDGKPDMVVANASVSYQPPNSSPALSVFRNTSTTGSISFGPKTDYICGNGINCAFTADLDGDNYTDIITGSNSSVNIIRNTSSPGSISFETKKELKIAGLYSQGINVNDLNGDGKPEIISSEYWFVDSVAVFQNLSVPGTLIFAPRAEYAAANFPEGVASGDLDGDGKPDMAALNHEGNFPDPTTVSLFRNLSGSTKNIVCTGTNSSMGAGLTGTNYQWQQSTGAGFSNVANNAVLSGTNTATLQLTSVPLSYNGYVYRCIVDGKTGNERRLVVSSTNLIPSVSIRAAADTVCSGSTAVLTANTINGGSVPSYQWQVNGSNTGSNSPVFSSAALATGSQVKLTITGNSTCINPATATSNTIIITVLSTVAPSISISGITSVTTGQNTLLTAVPANGGTSPAYQWQDSTSTHNWQNIVGATALTLTYTPAQTGDKVRCRITNNTPCVTQTQVFSNVLSFTVSAVTAINPDPAAAYGIRYYPNPAGAEITIDSLRITDRWETAEIINMSGARYGTITIANKTRITLNIKRLVPGQYIIALRRKNAVAYLKFIKQ